MKNFSFTVEETPRNIGDIIRFVFVIKEIGRFPKAGEYYTIASGVGSMVPKYHWNEALPYTQDQYIILKRGVQEELRLVGVI